MNIDALIEKYHDGEIEDDELATLNDWLLADQANQAYFLESGAIRSEIVNVLSVDNNNKKTAKLRTHSRSKHERNRKVILFTNRRVIMAAAGLLICILSYYIYQGQQITPNTNIRTLLISAIHGDCTIVNKETSFPARPGYHLQDGDRLNTKSDSSITLEDRHQNQWKLGQVTSTHFTPQELQLLTGTVHSNINPNLQHTIHLSTEFCAVHVTGTKFSVSHDNDLSTIQVTQGRVRVEHRNRKQLHVSGGHQLSLNQDDFIYTSMTEWAKGFTLAYHKTGKIIPEFDPFKDGDQVSLSKYKIDTISVNTNLNPEIENVIERVDLYINNKLLKVFILKEELWDMEQIRALRLHTLDHTFGETRIHAVPYFRKQPGQTFATQISIVE